MCPRKCTLAPILKVESKLNIQCWDFFNKTIKSFILLFTQYIYVYLLNKLFQWLLFYPTIGIVQETFSVKSLYCEQRQEVTDPHLCQTGNGEDTALLTSEQHSQKTEFWEEFFQSLIQVSIYVPVLTKKPPPNNKTEQSHRTGCILRRVQLLFTFKIQLFLPFFLLHTYPQKSTPFISFFYSQEQDSLYSNHF